MVAGDDLCLACRLLDGMHLPQVVEQVQCSLLNPNCPTPSSNLATSMKLNLPNPKPISYERIQPLKRHDSRQCFLTFLLASS